MFKKTTKRVISLILCLLMLTAYGSVAFGFVADPEAADLVAARKNFRQGMGPETKGYVTEYQYSSPVEGKEDSEDKYPVVFFIGTTTNISDVGAELRETSFILWSTEKYQKRFYNAGGAYIVLTRPQPIRAGIDLGILQTGNENNVRASLVAMMGDFIEKNKKNIDTSRIYLVAWDDGTKLATRIAAEGESEIAAMALLSPTYAPTTTELTNLAGVPIWLFACKQDEKVDYNTYGAKLWDGIKSSTADPGDTYVSRYTTFESFNTNRGSVKHHETWEFAAYDMHYTGEYSGVKTVDAAGRNVTFNSDDEGMISWMSRIGIDHTEGCDCPCHGTDDIMAKIMWFFKWMISMMLKIEKNRMCDCGVAHW